MEKPKTVKLIKGSAGYSDIPAYSQILLRQLFTLREL